VKLYTCGMAKTGAPIHFCARAAKALDDAGHNYELQQVDGYRLMPWTRAGDARAEVKRVSGQENVPVLLLDDGTAISGSGSIVDWAKSNPA